MATMPYVGVHIGTVRSVAVLSHSAPAPTIQPTVLYVSEDGRATLGVSDDPEAHSYSGFVHLVGLQRGLSDPSGNEYSAADLMASTLFCLLGEVALSVDDDVFALRAAATYPPEWTVDAIASLRSSIDAMGLYGVLLVDEDDALAAIDGAADNYDVALARGAALVAQLQHGVLPVAARDDDITDAIPLVVADAATRRKRWPVPVAVGLASVLVLAASIFALRDQATVSTPAVPVVDGAFRSAQTPTPPPTSATPNAPIAFPTVSPRPAELVPVEATAAAVLTKSSTLPTIRPPRAAVSLPHSAAAIAATTPAKPSTSAAAPIKVSTSSSAPPEPSDTSAPTEPDPQPEINSAP